MAGFAADSRPADAWRFARKVVLRRIEPVTLPPGLALNVDLPKYLLQEFHNLPNGNYSRSVTGGYSTGFDVSMLGSMRVRARRAGAGAAGRSERAGPRLRRRHAARALHDAGVPEVWGLDASPYLLQHAARRHPDLRFVQGLAESTGFPSRRFEAVCACFLFHELPPRAGDAALREIRRLLVPSGTLAILEPGIEQWKLSPLSLLRRYGCARVVLLGPRPLCERALPGSWHRRDVPTWLTEHGFDLIAQHGCFPTQLYVARLR